MADDSEAAPDPAPLFFAPEDARLWEDGLADVLPLETDEQWSDLQRRYELQRSPTTHNLRPWRRCLTIARARGAQVAVIERRYICYDYQSEYAAFYSQVLAAVPSTTHRIHFFECGSNGFDYRSLSPGQSESYLGYIVCRPRDLEIVGRTMLSPPMALPVLTTVLDTVTFFGQPLEVEAVPFMQQDERLGSCANVVAWSVQYSGYRRGQLARKYVAELSSPSSNFFRPKAVSGLLADELVRLLDTNGFRTYHYFRYPSDDIPTTNYPWHDDSYSKQVIASAHKDHVPRSLQELEEAEYTGVRSQIVEECCRCLNGGLPLIAGGIDHVVVICGYALTSDDRLSEFVVHDDQYGPYLLVLDCLYDREDLREMQIPDLPLAELKLTDALLNDLHCPSPASGSTYDFFEWLELVEPQPDRSFLEAYRAEAAAMRLILSNLDDARMREEQGESVPEMAALLEAERLDKLRFRTYLIRSNEYKAQIADDRGASLDLVRAYRGLRLSEWIWVVEYVEIAANAIDDKCLGETIFDATSSPKNPWVHALRLGTTVSLVYSNGRDETRGTRTSWLRPGGRRYERIRRLTM